MGAKQSTSPDFVVDGRTRAYSSSDLPSGNSDRIGFRYTNGPDGPRIRYTGGGILHANSAVTIPTNNNRSAASHGLDMEEEEGELVSIGGGGQRLLIGSLPAHLSPHLLGGFHCPVCTKYVEADEMEKHLFACFTKTSLSYNKDILSKDSGECSICLDEMEQGDTIARLPCLCIYHKGCIDEWFEVNRSCPSHPTE